MNQEQPSKPKYKNILHYRFGEDKLGEGSFGVVYRGKNLHTNEQVAVKQLIKKNISSDSLLMKNLQREIGIMKSLKHENIVQLLDVAQTPKLCDGEDILSSMKKNADKRFSEDIAIKYFRQICEGFKVLHQKGIIHRDIKPANILLHQGVAKISDFGFARELDQQNLNLQQYLTLLGTPLYMSPQILSNLQFSSKCDIWSLGVMFYEMIYGKTPWQASNQAELLNKINTQPLQFNQQIPSSYNTKDLLNRMLKIQENDRITWEEIFTHPLLIDQDQYSLEKSAVQNLSHILQYKIVEPINVDSNTKEHHNEMDIENENGSNQINNIDSQVLFFRNKTIIIKVLSCNIYDMYIHQELPVPSELFLKISWILEQCFLCQEKYMLDTLQDCEMFTSQFSVTKDVYFQYQNSQQKQRSVSILQQDLLNAEAYKKEIERKIYSRFQTNLEEPLQHVLNLGYNIDDGFYSYYSIVMNEFIIAIIDYENKHQLSPESKKKLYSILKLCSVIQDLETIFQASTDAKQFYEFYQKYEQISLDELKQEVKNELLQIYQNS